MVQIKIKAQNKIIILLRTISQISLIRFQRLFENTKKRIQKTEKNKAANT